MRGRESDLPVGSEVRFRAPTMWEQLQGDHRGGYCCRGGASGDDCLADSLRAGDRQASLRTSTRFIKGEAMLPRQP
jgi:hypothetical protein